MFQTHDKAINSSSSRIWFITGSSTGFGRALAEAVLAHGDRLVATARHLEQLQSLSAPSPEQLLTLALDVTNEAQCQEAVTQAMERFGQIDVLVNNAGYGLFGAIEETSALEVRQQFETNVFGLLNVTRAALPILRAQRRGHILMMSSIGGFVSFMGMGMYNASKRAVEGLSDALAQEIAPLGIHLTIIEPGLFRTDFTGRSLKVAERKIEDYAQTSGMVLDYTTKNIHGHEPGDPALAAAAILKVVEHPQPPLRLALGADALEMMRKKLDEVSQEWKTWEATSIATAFPTTPKESL
ncbi:oxidoreductase [Ktedonobacter racemifer]|uniref:Short-chain dehydrogenase/reductase SDR n=1 Tax=Ktedonobacter racemifer DSM 44963 TaxID=485913 RepID=D6U6W1_KTERA|nr:oxidoreductase [Ktedonobacter racemifer]EFH80722.1 short-chain dehydrogenase/reductase SDR [Ktedonobacter racemifer DSM 44963]